MAGLTDAGERAMLDAWLDGATFYAALFTATPGESGGGTEVSGGSYARQAIVWAAASTSTGTTTKKNSALITFPTPTASWGTISQLGVFTAVSAGTLVAFGDRTGGSAAVAIGAVVTVAIGDLSAGNE